MNPNVPRVFVNADIAEGLREIFGVHHMKIYIFDNNILISGFIIT